jgi:hypothetical protein
MITNRLDSDLPLSRDASWPERDEPAARKSRINNFMRDGLRKLDPDEQIPFFCECNSRDCFSTVWVSRRTLERIRGGANHSLSAHGRTAIEALVA